MTYASLMVHLELGCSNAGRLKIAAALAERFHAVVIGIAACQPVHIIYSEGFVAGSLIEQDQEEIDRQLKAAEQEFRQVLREGTNTLGWRSMVTTAPLADYLAHEARRADLFITGVDRNRSMFDTSRHVNTGDLVLQIGRPVLIVPIASSSLNLEHVLVGWRDTRETRLAVFQALPVLKAAERVSIVEVAAENQLDEARKNLKDVGAWLNYHSVMAEAIVIPASGDDAASLNAFAIDQKADLIVAGAYGHGRLREGVLGGVTRDLLLRADRCALVSH